MKVIFKSRKIRNILFLAVGISLFVSVSAFAEYDPKQGRFFQRDPVQGDGDRLRNQYNGGMDLYEFVASAPTSLVDPDGRDWGPMSGGPDFPIEPFTRNELDRIIKQYIDKWSKRCTKSLEKVCDKYKCCTRCPPKTCKEKAKSLCKSYVTQFDMWYRSSDKKFTDCYTFAAIIDNFNLSNDCFKVIKVTNLKQSHEYAAVFHVCNKTTTTDANLDPWRRVNVFGYPWYPYRPICKPGGPCNPLDPWPPTTNPAQPSPETQPNNEKEQDNSNGEQNKVCPATSQ